MPIEEFIAKPVVVKAIQWTGDNLEEIRRFCNNMAFIENDHLYIETLEGTSRARLKDWIAQGTMGEFYPIKPSIMEAKYDKLKDKAKRIVDSLGLE